MSNIEVRKHRSKESRRLHQDLQSLREKFEALTKLEQMNDEWDNEMDILDEELAFLDENIQNAVDVLNEQITTVLTGKQQRCTEAFDRIKASYESAAAMRAKTGERIPEMIEHQTNIVMKRVLDSAMGKAGDFHSDLDNLIARSRRGILQDFKQTFLNRIINPKASEEIEANRSSLSDQEARNKERKIKKRYFAGVFVAAFAIMIFAIFLRVIYKTT